MTELPPTSPPAARLLVAPVSPPETIRARYHRVPMDDDFAGPLGFSIILPRTWRGEVIDRIGPTPDRPLVAMARFFDPRTAEAPGPATAILGAHLPREVHPADWLRLFVAARGMRILDWRELPAPAGRMGEALVEGAGPTRGWFHRLTTIKDSNRILLIDSRSAEATPQGQEQGLIAAAEFTLTAPSDRPHAEPFRTTDLPAEAPVALLVPGLWHEPGLDTPPPPGGAIRMLENRRDDAMVGVLIAVAGQRGADPGPLEEVTLAKLQANGLHLTAGPDVIARFERPDGQGWLTARAWAGTREGNPVSVLSAQAVVQDSPVALTLLGPSAEADFETWAVNRRAFDIAVNSLRPG